MITLKTFLMAPLVALLFMMRPTVDTSSKKDPFAQITVCNLPKGCVFKTVFEDELPDWIPENDIPKKIELSTNRGLQWLTKAQLTNGGWGAGSHYYQDVTDPHAVNADPATTAMVAMALLRTGSTLRSGPYQTQLGSATEYLLRAVESTPAHRLQITEETNTQIQTKLGGNIDAILTLQYLSNIAGELEANPVLEKRVRRAMDVCAKKIQQSQSEDGSIQGEGWAGVLQSSLAGNALQTAQANGATVDEDLLKKANDYQKSNYDAGSGEVRTEKGAGIVLYSVSGSVRATAKDARRVKEEVEKAKNEGRISQDREVTPVALMEIGFSEEEAEQYASSYSVYESTKVMAQDEQVMSGFGNNGGEEFLSYLQTGESLIINKDNTWTEWYERMAGRMVDIQNENGSWSGHHCITSPVFCTATALLILSVEKDKEKLVSLGGD